MGYFWKNICYQKVKKSPNLVTLVMVLRKRSCKHRFRSTRQSVKFYWIILKCFDSNTFEEQNGTIWPFPSYFFLYWLTNFCFVFCVNVICWIFFVDTVTQLVIPPPHNLWKAKGGGILLLRYSMICIIGLTIFDLNGRGENRSPSL